MGNGQSTTFDNDLIDEDEELGSLTRQLAETAQGVREMSKELGRSDLPLIPAAQLTLANRSN